VSAYEFSFVIELSSEPPTPMLLPELASRVLTVAGCRPEQTTAAVEGLEAAVKRTGAKTGPSRLRFDATDGSVAITLATEGHPEWHSTHRIT